MSDMTIADCVRILRDFQVQHCAGGCKLISRGAGCRCVLCALDRLADLADIGRSVPQFARWEIDALITRVNRSKMPQARAAPLCARLLRLPVDSEPTRPA